MDPLSSNHQRSEGTTESSKRKGQRATRVKVSAKETEARKLEDLTFAGRLVALAETYEFAAPRAKLAWQFSKPESFSVG